MPRSSPLLHPPAADETGRGPAGIWALEQAAVIPLESFDIGPSIVLVPVEHVLLLTADLPLPGRRRRAEALPFAIEDRIAEPLGSVHVALGAELSPQRHLAGVVAHAIMAEWMARLAEAGLGHARIVPDALALPVPEAGGWSVDRTGERVCVRSDDGAGFALPLDHFGHAWAAAGRPRCHLFGAPLAPAFGGVPAPMVDARLAARLATPALDLRQGGYAPPRRAVPALWRHIAAVAAFGVIAHAAIAAADTAALHHIASEHAAATRTLIRQVAPGAVIGDDLSAAVGDLLPTNGRNPSAFLPLLVRVAGALKQVGTQASLRSVGFDASAGTLAIQVETTDIAGLQKVSTALTAQGLAAESGAASQEQGKAIGAFLIRGRT